MLKSRIIFAVLTCVTVIVGLLSRQITGIPIFIGDILWATMVYFIMRFLFVKKPIKVSIIAALLFCYGIEFSQLYKARWIDNLRHTLFGRLVLGDTFLWSDLLCYTVGIGIAVLIDSQLSKLTKFPKLR